MKQLFAAAAVFALALSGCQQGASPTGSEQDGNRRMGVLDMNLTLPDGTVIDEVTYTITGSALSTPRTDTVSVENSTQLRFRVGDLPQAADYEMDLAAMTAEGVSCAGTAPFVIDNTIVNSLMMQLICGDDSFVVHVDENGDISVTVEVVVNDDTIVCPVVTGISALPLEVLVGFDLQLTGHTTSADGVSYAWSGMGGSFAAASSSITAFTCAAAGDHDLTFTISKPECMDNSFGVTVTCTAGGGEAGAGGSEAGTGGSEAGTGGGGTGGGDPECDACLAATCNDYQGSGFNLYTDCLSSPDAAFQQACTDAYQCSVQAADGCADDLTRGPVSCYCGLDRTIDECNATSGTNAGPNGACIAEWEAATGCPAGDNVCVNNNFIDLSLASGFANYLTTCTVDPAFCGSVCRD